jgi:endonuclease-8
VPEGDTLHRIAERMRPLEGEVVQARSPHPRAEALGIAARIDGRRLERVEAVGKNLLLTFEGDVVVRSHLRMRGRWRVQPAGRSLVGTPWLVLRGGELEAILWNGPVLALGRDPVRRLGPDIMDDPPDLAGMVVRLRDQPPRREVGDALIDQQVVAGIGNIWRAEGLFLARISPFRPLGELSDEELEAALALTARAMRGRHGPRFVYRRTGLPCRRCAVRIRADRQGDEGRTVYWCPACQGGRDPAGA